MNKVQTVHVKGPTFHRSEAKNQSSRKRRGLDRIYFAQIGLALVSMRMGKITSVIGLARRGISGAVIYPEA